MTVIDRIEDGAAVLETDLGMITLPAELLPEGAKAGGVLVQRGGTWQTDEKETAARRAKIREKLRALTRNKND